MSNYATIDNTGFLKIFDDEKTARESSGNGKVVATEMEHKFNLPLYKGNQVQFNVNDGKMYEVFAAKESDGARSPINDDSLVALAERLK